MGQELISRRLQSTHWSEITSASHNRQQKGREALDRLQTRYHAAVLAHVSFKFRATEGAVQDLLRSFVVEKILENELLAQVNAAGGRVCVYRGGRDGALRRPRRVQRRNVGSHSRASANVFRPSRRVRGHRSAMSLPP